MFFLKITPITKKEFRNEDLLVAWLWYIFIMGVGVLFYDVIAIWIVSSFVFFRYREKKLKE